MAIDNRGWMQRLSGDYPAAAASCKQALELFRDLGHRYGQANAIGNLGVVQSRTGDYPAAAASLTQALGMFRDLGDREAQAEVLNDLGDLLSRSGDGQQARDHHTRALAIAARSARRWRKHAPWKASASACSGTATPTTARRTGSRHWQCTSASAPRTPGGSRKPCARHGITTAPPPPSGESRQPDAPTPPARS